MRFFSAPRLLLLVLVFTLRVSAFAQVTDTIPDAPAPADTQSQQPAGSGQAAQSSSSQSAPPATKPLSTHPAQTPAEAAEALRISKLAIINGRPYDQPSTKDTLIDYSKDTYLVQGQIRTFLRAGYSQIRSKPEQWNFLQRLGSAEAVTIIDGNVRLAMELAFHEDLRYIPCHGCTVKKKIENALLAEITARHDVDGHRFFTLTPTIADFSGPIIAHAYWYPNGFDPMGGVVATRLVFATRIGQRLFQEFVLERRHKDKPFEH